MSAFKQACTVEAAGMDDLLPFIARHSFEGMMTLTDKGNLSKELQEKYGDVFFNCKDKKIWAVEVKCEQDNLYGNVFLETWSNRSRWNPGWILKLQCDLLFFYFVKPKDLIVFNWSALRDWCFVRPGRNGHAGRIWDYPEKQQRKYDQLNDTWGRCVPIEVLTKEISGCKRHSLQDPPVLFAFTGGSNA